jgi:hypothetical protein
MSTSKKQTENLAECGNKSKPLLVDGRKYTAKFNEGDRVEVANYGGVLILDCPDEFLTRALNKLHWQTSSESYLQGKSKTNNGESYSEDEMKPCH